MHHVDKNRDFPHSRGGRANPEYSTVVSRPLIRITATQRSQLLPGLVCLLEGCAIYGRPIHKSKTAARDAQITPSPRHGLSIKPGDTWRSSDPGKSGLQSRDSGVCMVHVFCIVRQWNLFGIKLFYWLKLRGNWHRWESKWFNNIIQVLKIFRR